MKKLKFLILLFIGIFSLNMYALSPVDSVKYGKLNINPNITIEKAFQDYKYFSSTKWDSFEEDGITFVLSESELTYNYLFNNATDWTSELNGFLFIQFHLLNNQIGVNSVLLEYRDNKTGEVIQTKDVNDLNIGMNELLIILQEIYANKPISQLY